MRAEHLETPAILINRPVFDSNMEKMARLLAPLKVALRPHYKSHKSTDIAHLQVRAGAKGITCAKVSEAEDLALAGIEDILIANQITEKSRIARVAYLAKGWPYYGVRGSEPEYPGSGAGGRRGGQHHPLPGGV